MRKERNSSKKRLRKKQLLSGIIAFLVIGVVWIFFNWDWAKVQDTPSLSQESQIEESQESPSTIDKKEEPIIEKPTQEMTLEEKVDDIIAKMTLKEKIGQLMVVGFNSTTIDQNITSMISQYNVGGVILFDRNMETQTQVASLNRQLQDLAAKNEHGIPLYLSIDQEGGGIVRMRDQVSPIPSQQELGQKNNPDEVYQVAKRTGSELKTMGFNVNFAPVLDLSESDSRSFGRDPKKADTLGSQVIAGMADSGITATVKHFPGNGRSSVDPHKDSSSVKADKFDLENQDIYPFKKIIENKDHNQFFVMVTHIKYPAYDKENPASISPVIIQDLLREQLGYTGIVVTDDLEMGAVNKYFTYEDLGYRAIESGADLLLVCHTYENQQKVFNGILAAVEGGQLSEKRIDESVKRILTHKYTSMGHVGD